MPLFAKAGDVTIVNRQALHASFANTSKDTRISLTFGFHRRSSVLGACGALSQTNDEVYDAERIDQRSRVIAVAIDARQQFYPQEDRYSYQPYARQRDRIRVLRSDLEQSHSRLQLTRSVDLARLLEAK